MKYHGWEWAAYDYRFITELSECKDIICLLYTSDAADE